MGRDLLQWAKFCSISRIRHYPAGNYMFKVNNRDSRTRFEICSQLTIKTSERHLWCCSGEFFVNFEHISHLLLMDFFVNFE